MQIAENLHPVTSPAVDAVGNIYTTFSGSRGQKVPVAVYKIDLNFSVTPFINDMMNATGIAVGRGWAASTFRAGSMAWCIRSTPNGNMSVFVEGMGVATGIVFDEENNLYVGDRSGTIFKISPTRQIFVFATHRAFDLGISSGLGTGPAPVCERPDDFELRQHLSRGR